MQPEFGQLTTGEYNRIYIQCKFSRGFFFPRKSVQDFYLLIHIDVCRKQYQHNSINSEQEIKRKTVFAYFVLKKKKQKQCRSNRRFYKCVPFYLKHLLFFFQTGEHHYLSKNYPYNCNNYISKLLSSSIEQKTASACYQLVRVDKYMPNMYLIFFTDQSNSCTLKKRRKKKCIMITYTF